MSTARTAALAIGASLFGSAFATFLIKPGTVALALSTAGVLVLLLGTGFLREAVVRRILRTIREKRPVIAIIGDLPWTPDRSQPPTYIWAWHKMDPAEWQRTITEDAKQVGVRVKVKQIMIMRSHVRFFLDRYSVVLNPYGSAYPEVDIKDLPVLHTILDYVLHGGLLVNVADIPFYWAYDPQRGIFYDLAKYSHQYIPTRYKSDGNAFCLEAGYIRSFGPFPETPFLREVKVTMTNTEGDKGRPPCYDLSLKDDSLDTKQLSQVAVNRAALVDTPSEYKSAAPLHRGRVESIVKEIGEEGQAMTPLCYVNFGKGRFLISLAFLDSPIQQEQTNAQIIRLLRELILKSISH
jgi:hypothetical protein